MMKNARHARYGLFLAAMLCMGCNKILELVKGGGPAAEAEALLKSGDLPAAADAFAAANQSDPTSVDAAAGAAYTQMLVGDTSAADAILEAAEAGAGDRLGEIKMRRALVAMHAGDLESVKTHGLASGNPVGALLAAEVDLAEGEVEDAKALLEGISEPAEIKAIAAGYLEWINDPEPLVSGLSELQALWALGKRTPAVKSVEPLVTVLPAETDEQIARRSEQMLLWAGRAASVGEPEIGRSLLEQMLFPPSDMLWRKVATDAILDCAEGKGTACLQKLDGLDGQAPADGLADARITAAQLIAPRDKSTARKLVGDLGTDAAARVLLEAGDQDGATAVSAEGALGAFIAGGG